MRSEAQPIRLVAAALGAVLMAVSVFLPWYSIALTGSGAARVGQLGDQLATQYGNASLQNLTQSYQSSIGRLVGTPIATASAHDVLHVISVVLLVLAAVALLDALVPLARVDSPLPYGAGGSLAVLGLLACLLIGYRMAVAPSPAEGLVSLSLREGAWLCLIGAGTVLIAGLWPVFGSPGERAENKPDDVFAQLSGWSPPA